MGRRFSSLFAACLAAGAAIAVAQPGADRPIAAPSDDGVRTLHDFAGCIADLYPHEARRVLAMDFRTPLYGRAIRMLSQERGRCFRRGRMQFSGLLFAGGLAEQLYRHRASAAPAGQDFPARGEAEAMSFCLVRRAPRESEAVLATAPASPEEAAALDALRPALGQCLGARQQAQLNRPGLRALVALALYRLSAA